MSVINTTLLQRTRVLRQKHKLSGWLAAALTLLTIVVLTDGLVAEMRAGNDRFDVLAGTEMLISGPTPLKSPAPDDFIAQGQSPDVHIELQEFFPSYWFGSSMWRAKLTVQPQAASGEYPLVVSFRTAPPQNTRTLQIMVWHDVAEMQANALSYVQRYCRLNAFWAAGVLALMAAIVIGINFMMGKKFSALLADAGLAEIYFIQKQSNGSCKAHAFRVAGSLPVKGASVAIFRNALSPTFYGSFDSGDKNRVICTVPNDVALGDWLQVRPVPAPNTSV